MKRVFFKKITATGLSLALLLSMTACGEDKGDVASGSAVTGTVAEATEEPTPEPTPEATPDPDNMIEDGGFDGFSAWAIYKTNGGSGTDTITDGEMQVSISDIGEVEHSVQIYYDGFSLDKGAKYTFSFDARSTVPRKIDARFQMNGGDYHAYNLKKIDLTTEMKTFSYDFTMKEESDPAPRLCFNMGYKGKEDDGIGEHDIFFDNMRLVLADNSNVEAVKEEAPEGIRVNQVGYRPKDVKTAVFADISPDEDSYKIVDAKTGKKVYTGMLGSSVSNASAGETDRIADFSDFTKNGTYRIVAKDGTKSPQFTISDNVYDDLFRKAVKMLYLQRCGMELDKKTAGRYAHKKCHCEKARLYVDEDVHIDVSGGWHDAGDYGRYVVAGAKAAADVLLAYENYAGKKIIDDVGTCESGDGVDDLLQEVRYELDWMLKMQTDEGKVYHKVTCANFPSTVMPEEETEELIVSRTSSPATADFAAVMALASRIFGKSGNAALKKAGKKYLKAAEKSWKWLAANPDVKNYTNPDDIVTGEYPDEKDGDERFWAACELYRTTGKNAYVKDIASLAEEEENLKGLGWQDMGLYGCYAALMNKKYEAADSATAGKIRSVFDRFVTETMGGVANSPYAINRSEEFEWGSNLGIANDGVLLQMADKINQKNEHRGDAGRMLSYLLGENATGYCFVTGMSKKSAKHPHHRVSQVIGKAIPGMLVGGPDNALEDPYAKKVLADKPAAKCYADSDQSYSTNEVTIYWNSPLILLLSGY